MLVISERKTVENPKRGMKPKKVGRLKMTVIDDLKADTITKNVKEQVEQTSDIISDYFTSYTKLKEVVQSHKASVVAPEQLAKVLCWVHTAISNAKRQLLRIYYKVKPE